VNDFAVVTNDKNRPRNPILTNRLFERRVKLGCQRRALRQRGNRTNNDAPEKLHTEG
jgi:hypothetical protein